MTTRERSTWLLLFIVAGLAATLAIPVGEETIGARFLASLRIAKPRAVTAAAPGVGAANGGRLQNMILGILAETTSSATDEPDISVPNADSATRAAGFRVHLLGARSETASIDVVGAHSATIHINRGQLQTLFLEAGRSVTIADALSGAPVTLARPRGVRLQYGHCPAPIAATLQNQIQGPPPPSTDNGDCVILTEIPLATLTIPSGLDTASVMAIALELSGMSPNQTRDFRSLFDWRAALALSPPRGMRSYELRTVGGNRAMLMITAGRREPTYTLAWVRDDIVYTLAGYGGSGDALPLAESVR